MRWIWIALLAVIMLPVSGCINPSIRSMNIQRAGIRSAGDMSVTVSLDSLDTPAQSEEVCKKTKEITIAIDEFLKTGNLAMLTIPEITGKLRDLVPAEYRFLLDLLIAQADVIHVPVDKIGADNVRRMQSFCKGIIYGCNEYKIEDRPQPNDGDGLVKSIPNDAPKKFGVRLKKEMAKNKR